MPPTRDSDPPQPLGQEAHGAPGAMVAQGGVLAVLAAVSVFHSDLIAGPLLQFQLGTFRGCAVWGTVVSPGGRRPTGGLRVGSDWVTARSARVSGSSCTCPSADAGSLAPTIAFVWTLGV